MINYAHIMPEVQKIVSAIVISLQIAVNLLKGYMVQFSYAFQRQVYVILTMNIELNYPKQKDDYHIYQNR